MKIKAISLAILMSVSSVASVVPVTANATGIPVFDGANFANMITNAANQATQISNQVEQINSLLRGNALSEQALKQLGLGNYSGLLSKVNKQASEVNKLLATSKSLKQSVGQVQNEFKSLYSQAGAKQTPDQMLANFSKWSNQLQDANKTAMQAQATINNIADRNQQISSILNESAGGAGASQVAQIQSSNQLLGVVAQQMNDLNSVMAASQRATITAQAQAQAEKDAMRADWKNRNDISKHTINSSNNKSY